MITHELLEHLKKEDPHAWERFARVGIVLFGFEDQTNYTLTSDIGLAWMQFVLQDAIKNRGWDYVVRSTNSCIITERNEDESDAVNTFSDFPAESLLLAYLDILDRGDVSVSKLHDLEKTTSINQTDI